MEQPAILVTGGCGYIGSHTIVDLLQHGFRVVCLDNNARSGTSLLEGIASITGTRVVHERVDLCDFNALRAVFERHRFSGVIHFAAFKAVDESVREPLLYFHNNLSSLVNILRCCEDFGVQDFVFSSSCSVYGNADEIPVKETTPRKEAESPYALTKQMGEDIIMKMAVASSMRFVLLRYFNPAGAHPGNQMGEIPYGPPANLVPVITRFAAGKIAALRVFGTDYPTRDGSCMRDFIHVCDIASAHTLALQNLQDGKNKTNCEIFNLGTGNGVTVLETIHAFEKVTGKQLAYQLADRRPGDVIAIYANNEKARQELGWIPRYNLEDIMRTAWQWEQQLP